MTEPARLRILVLEDNPQDVFLLREALARAGLQHAQLMHVERVADALLFLTENPVDLILTDLNLPDSAGLETVRVLAEKVSHVPILVLTGHSDRELEHEIRVQGATGQLSKDDLRTEAFADTVHHALRYLV